jgi:hypothetical protein
VELRSDITVLALRATVRAAGAMHTLARAFGEAGERLESVVDRQAKHELDISDEPLVAPIYADAARGTP